MCIRVLWYAKARRHQSRMIQGPTDERQTAEYLSSSFGAVLTR